MDAGGGNAVGPEQIADADGLRTAFGREIALCRTIVEAKARRVVVPGARAWQIKAKEPAWRKAARRSPWADTARLPTPAAAASSAARTERRVGLVLPDRKWWAPSGGRAWCARPYMPGGELPSIEAG